MDNVLAAALRRFVSEEHIKNLLAGKWVDLFDETGTKLHGIRGRIGVSACTLLGHEIGVDLMEMKPGSAFPLHKHDGDHILYILEGIGTAHVAGRDHKLTKGDS